MEPIFREIGDGLDVLVSDYDSDSDRASLHFSYMPERGIGDFTRVEVRLPLEEIPGSIDPLGDGYGDDERGFHYRVQEEEIYELVARHGDREMVAADIGRWDYPEGYLVPGEFYSELSDPAAFEDDLLLQFSDITNDIDFRSAGRQGWYEGEVLRDEEDGTEFFLSGGPLRRAGIDPRGVDRDLTTLEGKEGKIFGRLLLSRDEIEEANKKYPSHDITTGFPPEERPESSSSLVLTYIRSYDF